MRSQKLRYFQIQILPFLYYDVTADPPVDDLILYTCWNNGYMGLSDQRLYVICKVISKEYKIREGKICEKQKTIQLPANLIISLFLAFLFLALSLLFAADNIFF